MTEKRAYKRYSKEFKEEAVALVPELSDDERDELKRLRKELRMEKEILKKASAFFAKEMK
ncbi:hypothetical protein JL456_23840 [Vibrio neptunius]|uniref:Transposase n=1 Tax=Vibrio neptunius TaxID=170651 RepID=A0ABS3A830_9VIBR|nr:hypothetical protein [Vibrio neptunius]MBN3518256.1 hypothetical protein [Vibrio neptunius]MBN3552585.1 hypothetical protein [Vibrio neptunius]MBN3580646.1 hypothetical protein [Vibrio neptunius]MCH9874312.1 hypothetical protein [Vibrio neptunius]